ncbi:MAG: hypothetical protein JKY82_07595 [Rhizobiaceae bacterium]|nr:hypothetical protein [Rhizobiaceae bacterium]
MMAAIAISKKTGLRNLSDDRLGKRLNFNVGALRDFKTELTVEGQSSKQFIIDR